MDSLEKTAAQDAVSALNIGLEQLISAAVQDLVKKGILLLKKEIVTSSTPKKEELPMSDLIKKDAPLPFSLKTVNGSIVLSADANTSLSFTLPAELGSPEEIASAFDFSFDAVNKQVLIKTKKPITITLPDPKNFIFGESQDKQAAEAEYDVPVPPFGFVHLPFLLGWKPSTGTLDVKLWKGIGTNI